MTIEEAIEYAEKKKIKLEEEIERHGSYYGAYAMYSTELEFVSMAISALRQQETVANRNGLNEPLTLEELSKRNDPVFVPINDFTNGGYWCLCQNGYIIPPSGYGFMAKERQNWVFYSQKPEEGTV